jgi:pyrroline-5-carboxylate reductase
VVLSIAAGRTIAGFERHLASGTAVIRSMPNTPAAIGRGITVAVGNPHVTPAQRQACDGLLAAVGEVAWVDDEDLLDAVTAVSGSGPAYAFYLAECLGDAGIAAGLEPALAKKLARWTVAGAGELLHRSDLGADTLRQNVTSPGGTTFAALQVLMADQGLPKLMREAVAAATRRSRELAK